MNKPLVGIIMGSDSDLPVMSAAAAMCDEFGIDYEVTVVSAHRTPDRLVKYAKTAEKKRNKSNNRWSWWSCSFTWYGCFNDRITCNWSTC